MYAGGGVFRSVWFVQTVSVIAEYLLVYFNIHSVCVDMCVCVCRMYTVLLYIRHAYMYNVYVLIYSCVLY